MFNGGMTNEPVVKTCGCGCGAEVARTYLPGHDARHKAALVAQANGSNRQQADRAIRQLMDRGWTAYADLASLRQFVYRDHQGRGRTPWADVTTWLVGPEGMHHARHGCASLTAEAQRAGYGAHPITKLAPQAAIWRRPNDLFVMLDMGWNGCPTCAVETTLDEVTEWAEYGKRDTLAIYDRDGMTKLGNKSKTPKHRRPEATHITTIQAHNTNSRHPQRQI